MMQQPGRYPDQIRRGVCGQLTISAYRPIEAALVDRWGDTGHSFFLTPPKFQQENQAIAGSWTASERKSARKTECGGGGANRRFTGAKKPGCNRAISS